jgi:hypothetical protein
MAQLPLNEEEFFSRLKRAEVLPQDLLSSRSVVFHPYSMNSRELEMMQSYFQRTGIDAVVYFENDLLTAGRDVAMATAQYLISREISNLILIEKTPGKFVLSITPFNKKANFVEQNQVSWTMEHRLLEEILKNLYRTASNGLKKENYLINDVPEVGFGVNPIGGRRSEFFAVDLKVDPLAVPKFGNETMDKELEEIMKMYPFKYTFTDPNLSEADLRKQGHLFVLRFVNARDKVAKSVMGYDMSKAENVIVSVTYPGNEPLLKNIHANAEVFKFYFKHIDSGNVYLGTKWDADVTWQQALINQLKGLKVELRVN